MKLPRSRLVPALLLLVAGCAKQADAPQPAPPPPGVQLVGVAEQSLHFAAVNRQLELGGTLYGYVDIDGDALSFAGTAQGMAKSLVAVQPQYSMFAKQDFKDVFTTLGLDDVKAIGVSSVHEPAGAYRNRTFLYTPQGRHGFFAVFGGVPAPFAYARLAPADADFFAEHEFNLKAVYDTVEALVAKANGPDAATSFRAKVQKVGIDAHFSLLELINGLNGRFAFILRLDPVKNLKLPGALALTVPAPSFLLRVDGVGAVAEGMLEPKLADYTVTKQGTLTLYAPKADAHLEGLKPVLAIDGGALYVASTEAFLTESLARKDGLDTNPVFKADLAALGPQGNGLTWVSPRFLERMKDLATLNAGGPPPIHKFLETYTANLPHSTEPMLSVRTNLADGILIRSRWNKSLKGDLAMVMVYNPVTVGVIAAMAIPAYQKTRAAGQAAAIQNNLRMLAAAADQFYLDHGVDTATYDDLVGPDKLVKAIVPVEGEDYHALDFRKGASLYLKMPDGRIVSNRPPGTRPHPVLGVTPPPDSASPAVEAAPAAPEDATPPQDRNEKIILRQMGRLRMAANAYYRNFGVTTVTYDQLVGPGKLIPRLVPVVGENYSTIQFVQGQPLQLALPSGRVLVLPEDP
jgi:hypothetical protein